MEAKKKEQRTRPSRWARRAKAKSAYSCFLPANPITYPDFMVISTKAGSCRCSHVEGPRTQDGGPRTRTRAWARPTTRTNNWRKVLWRPVLHFALDMSLCAKSERQRNGNGIGQGSGWLAKRTLAVTCVCHLVYATVCNCN